MKAFGDLDTPLEGSYGVAPHCSPEVRLEVLRRTPLFGSLDDAALRHVNERCRAIPCDAGETIHHQGGSAERLYVVATGAVKLLRHGAGGRPMLHDVVAPGETFGSLQALGDDAYAYDAVALRPGCLLLLSAETFRDLLHEVPGVARSALRITADRLREAQGSVQDLGTMPVDARLAGALLRLAAKVGEEAPDGVRFTVAPSQVDLAAMIGTSPESVSRTFARWRARGLLRTGEDGPVLLDLPALEALHEQVA